MVENINHIIKSERWEACHVNGCLCILFGGYSDLSFVTLRTGREVEKRENFGSEMIGKSDCPESTVSVRVFHGLPALLAVDTKGKGEI